MESTSKNRQNYPKKKPDVRICGNEKGTRKFRRQM